LQHGDEVRRVAGHRMPPDRFVPNWTPVPTGELLEQRVDAGPASWMNVSIRQSSQSAAVGILMYRPTRSSGSWPAATAWRMTFSPSPVSFATSAMVSQGLTRGSGNIAAAKDAQRLAVGGEVLGPWGP